MGHVDTQFLQIKILLAKLVSQTYPPFLGDNAWEFRNKIIQAVWEKQFVVVCNGVTSLIVPGLNDDAVPNFNEHPVGPHASGSYEVKITRIRAIDRRKIKKSQLEVEARIIQNIYQ